MMQTENTVQEEHWLKPHQFKPGQSGNPAGRPRGARNKLADDFIADAYAEWQANGPAALKAMAKNDPSKFCTMIANLLPKESVFQTDDARTGISEIKLVIINAPNNVSQGIIENSESVPESRPVPVAANSIAQLEHKPDDTITELVPIETKLT